MNEFYTPVSHKSKLLAIILCCVGFCGVGGPHRFYSGKLFTGLLWLLTGGLFGIGTIVDLIRLVTGTFTDGAGFPLVS